MSLQLRAQNDWYTGVSASLPPPPFDPTQIAGLALWLDATDASTFTLDGSNNVEQWRDKSGGARHRSQSTVLNRPSYLANQINGLHAVVFDGAGDCFADTSMPNTANNLHMFMVMNATGTGSFQNIFETSASNSPQVWIRPANQLEVNGAGLLSTNIVTGANRIIEVRIRTSGSPNLATWLNGSTNGTANSAVASWANPWTMRNFNRAGTLTFNGKIGEQLIWDGALTDDNRTAVTTYLSAKWGIT